MFVITHALAPVVAATALNAARLTQTNAGRLFNNVHLAMIGLAGASPDLLSPHWKLSARLQSPTHTVWYLFAVYPVCLCLGGWLGRPRSWLIANWMWFAVFLHLVCDAAAGGIAWLYPWQTTVIGGSFIPFSLWFVSDALVVAATIWLQYQVNALEMKRHCEELNFR